MAIRSRPGTSIKVVADRISLGWLRDHLGDRGCRLPAILFQNKDVSSFRDHGGIDRAGHPAVC